MLQCFRKSLYRSSRVSTGKFTAFKGHVVSATRRTGRQQTISRMYVCIIEHLRSRRPYSLDCHGGAIEMYHCALENITVFL